MEPMTNAQVALTAAVATHTTNGYTPTASAVEHTAEKYYEWLLRH